MHSTTLHTLSKTNIQLILDEPFYGHYLTGMLKEINTEVATAAVQLFGESLLKLKVNADFWANLSLAHRYGVLKHEVLHIVFQHLLLCRKYSHQGLYNIAADLVVNQYILPEQLPEYAITLRKFNQEQLHLLPLQSVDYYYEKLSKKWRENQPKAGYFFRLMTENQPALEQHKHWQDFQKISAASAQILATQLNRNLKNTLQRLQQKGLNYRSLPAGLIEQLEALVAQLAPKMNWRRVLRLFAASSTSSYLKNTLRRPSKRYGTTPGIRLQRRHHLLVAIDTSGSIQQADLQAFLGEIQHIWQQKARITIVECDTHIHAEYTYQGKSLPQVKARGGTQFDAPLQAANERIHPDAIIYFTDGFAAAPKVVSRYPILWLISSNGLQENSDAWEKLPGRKVKMNVTRTCSW